MIAADSFLLHSVQGVPEEIVSRFRGDLPPEGECRGSVHAALHMGTLRISHCSGLGGIDTVMGCHALGEPVALPTRGDVKGSVKGLGQGYAGDESQGNVPRHPPTRGADRHGVASQRYIGCRRQGQGRSPGTTGDGSRGEEESYPRGEPRDGEGDVMGKRPPNGTDDRRAHRSTLGKEERRRGRRQGKGPLGRRQQLVHPSRIQTATPRGVLLVLPAQGMFPRSQRMNLVGPVNLAGDSALLDTVNGKAEKVISGLGGNLPPKGEHIGTVHPALKKRALPVTDGPRLNSIDPVMGRCFLAEPGGRSPRNDRQGGVKGVGQGSGDGEHKSDHPGHPPPHCGDRHGVASQGDVSRRRQGHDRAAGTGRRDECGREGSRYPRWQPSNTEGDVVAEPLGDGGGNGRAPRPPRDNQERRGIGCQRERFRQLQGIDPSSILTVTIGGIFRVRPAKRVNPRGNRHNNIGPINFAADSFLFHPIDFKPEEIPLRLGGDLPPEGDGRGAGHHAFHERALTVTYFPRLGCVYPVMSDGGLGKPGEIPPRGNVASRVKSLGQ